MILMRTNVSKYRINIYEILICYPKIVVEIVI